MGALKVANEDALEVSPVVNAIGGEVLDPCPRTLCVEVEHAVDDEKVVARAEQLLHELDPFNCVSSPFDVGQSVHEEIMERLDLVMNGWTPFRSRRLPVFEEIATFRDQIAC